MRVYISGALSGSRDLAAARDLYERAALAVSQAGHEPYIPHATNDPERAATLAPESVYEFDMNAVHRSDAVLQRSPDLLHAELISGRLRVQPTPESKALLSSEAVDQPLSARLPNAGSVT